LGYFPDVVRCWLATAVCLLWVGLSGCLAPNTPLPPSETPLVPSVTPTLTSTIVWFPPTVTPTPFPTQPPPTLTPDLHPGLGEAILEDDFAAADPWLLSRAAVGNVALGKHELTIAIAAPKTYLFTLRQQPLLTDFYAEITASPTLCRGQDEYGLLVRVSPDQDYYRFSVSCDGQVRADRVYQGQATSPQPWMLSDAVFPGAPVVTKLAVWAVGKEMRFFVNDLYQFTVKDPLLPSGALGVFARSAGDLAVTVSFSDLRVYAVQVNP
jgi:hypothetical protein